MEPNMSNPTRRLLHSEYKKQKKKENNNVIIRPREWLICWADGGEEMIFGLREEDGNEREIRYNPKELFKLQQHINHLIKYGIKYNYFKKIRKEIIK